MSNPHSFSFACPCPTPWAPPSKKDDHKDDHCKCGKCKLPNQNCCDFCLKGKCCDEAAAHLASLLSLTLGAGIVGLNQVARSADGIRIIPPGIVQVQECGKYLIGLFIGVSVGLGALTGGPLELVVEDINGNIRVLFAVPATLLITSLAQPFSTVECLNPGDRVYLRNNAVLGAVLQAGISLSVAKLCCD